MSINLIKIILDMIKNWAKFLGSFDSIMVECLFKIFEEPEIRHIYFLI